MPDPYVQLGKGDIVSVYIGAKAEFAASRREVYSFVTYAMVIALSVAVAAHILLQTHGLRAVGPVDRPEPQGRGDLGRPRPPRHRRGLRHLGPLRGHRRPPLLRPARGGAPDAREGTSPRRDRGGGDRGTSLFGGKAKIIGPSSACCSSCSCRTR